MTYVAFNYKRVLMAVQKQQLQSDNIPAFRIFEWARTQLQKVDELYHKRKKEVIVTTAERLEGKGFPTNKICHEISKQLSDYVNDAYVREILPAKYKDQRQSNNATVGVENRAKLAVKTLVSGAQTQQIEGHIECESCPEAYDIDKVKSGAYTYEYLQELCIWLHETLELNCKGK